MKGAAQILALGVLAIVGYFLISGSLPFEIFPTPISYFSSQEMAFDTTPLNIPHVWCNSDRCMSSMTLYYKTGQGTAGSTYRLNVPTDLVISKNTSSSPSCIGVFKYVSPNTVYSISRTINLSRGEHAIGCSFSSSGLSVTKYDVSFEGFNSLCQGDYRSPGGYDPRTITSNVMISDTAYNICTSPACSTAQNSNSQQLEYYKVKCWKPDTGKIFYNGWIKEGESAITNALGESVLLSTCPAGSPSHTFAPNEIYTYRMEKVTCPVPEQPPVQDVCGDGQKTTGEICDPSDPATASQSCTILVPDDGTKTCQPCPSGGGLSPGYTACSKPAACGNNVVETGEECDDGNEISSDSCINCKNAKCSDGYYRTDITNPSDPKYEQCDDGNTINTDACTSACRLPVCGDRYAQAVNNEECDDGKDGDNTDECLDSCKIPKCQDGYKRVGYEECDDGNSVDIDGCTNACRLPVCGDGIKSQNEPCEIGNTEQCTLFIAQGTRTCQSNNGVCQWSVCSAPNQCGNQILESGEQCDDGNTINDDGCTNSCRTPVCGDGIRHVGIYNGVTYSEECDDGNGVNTDSCVQCKNSFCGDGYTRAIVEQCDDKNTNNNDDCLNTCRIGVCGDGIKKALGTNIEQCDDGDTINTNLCTNRCEIPRCGDNLKSDSEVCELNDPQTQRKDGCAIGSVTGFQLCQNNNGICQYSVCQQPNVCGNGNPESGEQCDDGNLNDFDSCSNACMRQECGDGDIDSKIGETCEPGINPVQSCTDFTSGKLGKTTCSSATCTFLNTCDTLGSECSIGVSREPCGFGGYYECKQVNIQGLPYGRYDRTVCVNSGECSSDQTRVVYGSRGWAVPETCANYKWPSTTSISSCTEGGTCAFYQDACSPYENRTCSVGGIPGIETCKTRDGGFSACQTTGTCIPGTNITCGECGFQTCDSSGKYTPCQPKQNFCGSQFVCQKGASTGLLQQIFAVFSAVPESSYTCSPIEPVIIIQPAAYAIKSPIKIPVKLLGPDNTTLRGVFVKGEVRDNFFVIATSDEPGTDADGSAILSFIPEIQNAGFYTVSVKATVGGKETIKETQIEVKGRVDVSMVYDQIQYYNKPITVLLKFTDDAGTLVTDIASLSLNSKVGPYTFAPKIIKASNGILASFDANRAGMLEVTGTYKLTVNALEKPLSLSVDVRQPFVDIKNENLIVPHDVQTSKRNIFIKFTNPQGEKLAMNSQEFTVTITDPTGAINTVTMSPLDDIKSEWQAEYNYAVKGEYIYKISVNKPGYGSRTYGEAPFPVISSSILGAGGLGGAGGSVPNPLNLGTETIILGVVVLVVVVGGGLLLVRR